MKKTFKEHWRYIDSHMEWNYIYICMKAIDWTWTGKSFAGIPNINTIRNNVYSMCLDLYNDKDIIQTKTVFGGGFEIIYNKEEDVFTVAFILTCASTHDLKEAIP